MDRNAIIAELTNILSDYLKSEGFELVDIIYRYEGADLVLRILADRPEGGINLDECAYLNTEICKILDERNLVQQNYILEVSSPGLDRPLRSKNDFLRCINRRVKIFLREAVAEKLEMDGTIIKADDDSVYIDMKGNNVRVPLFAITKAKQIIEDI